MGLHIQPCPEMCAVLNRTKTPSGFWRGVFVGYKLVVLLPSLFHHHRSSHTHISHNFSSKRFIEYNHDGLILWNTQVRIISDIMFAHTLIRPAYSKTSGQLHSMKGNVVEAVSTPPHSFRFYPLGHHLNSGLRSHLIFFR